MIPTFLVGALVPPRVSFGGDNTGSGSSMYLRSAAEIRAVVRLQAVVCCIDIVSIQLALGLDSDEFIHLSRDNLSSACPDIRKLVLHEFNIRAMPAGARMGAAAAA